MAASTSTSSKTTHTIKGLRFSRTATAPELGRSAPFNLIRRGMMGILDFLRRNNPADRQSANSNPFDSLSPEIMDSVRSIQSVLSPDLLKPEYRRQLPDGAYSTITFGHCYVAAEVAYHLFAAEQGFVPYMAKAEESTHWWLVNEDTGEILDPTYPQLDGNFEVYERGKRRAFLPQSPSKRAREVMRRLSDAQERR